MPVEAKPDEESIGQYLASLARKLSGYRGPISVDTRLWHDVGISGDDAWEMLKDLQKQFGTNFRGIDARYWPNEGEITFRFLGKLFGIRDKRPPLTVGHLANIIKHGQWFEPP